MERAQQCKSRFGFALKSSCRSDMRASVTRLSISRLIGVYRCLWMRMCFKSLWKTSMNIFRDVKSKNFPEGCHQLVNLEGLQAYTTG